MITPLAANKLTSVLLVYLKYSSYGLVNLCQLVSMLYLFPRLGTRRLWEIQHNKPSQLNIANKTNCLIG